MGTSKAEGKRSLKEMEEYDQEEEEEDEDNTTTAAAGTLAFEDDDVERKKKGKAAAGGSSSAAVVVSCQAHNCGADMTDAKRYHRRHKVCEHHAKAPFVLVAGVHQRFCQQCSRFHELSEFDDNKRSCRRRLAGHNERRRKNSYDYHGEASI